MYMYIYMLKIRIRRSATLHKIHIIHCLIISTSAANIVYLYYYMLLCLMHKQPPRTAIINFRLTLKSPTLNTRIYFILYYYSALFADRGYRHRGNWYPPVTRRHRPWLSFLITDDKSPMHIRFTKPVVVRSRANCKVSPPSFIISYGNNIILLSPRTSYILVMHSLIIYFTGILTRTHVIII